MDLKCYCTRDMYDNYRKGGILYACLPSMRRLLFTVDSREQHKDLNIRLSIDRRKHKIEGVEGFQKGWYAIQRG